MSGSLPKPPFFWPHLDYGKEQLGAEFACGITGINVHQLEHSQRVGKATFRLIDRDLYRPEWVAEHLPSMKAYWRQERDRAARESVSR